MKRQPVKPRQSGAYFWLMLLLLITGCDAWDLPHLTGNTSTLTNGLVAYYTFPGNTLDASGNNLNGQLLNGATYGPDRNTTAQSALLLDGVDDYFEISDNSKLRSSAISISLWINAKQVTSSSHLYNKSVWADHTNQQYSAFIRPPQSLTSGNACCELWADVNQDGSCSIEQPIQQPISYYDPAFGMSRWYHIVTVFSGKTGKIYVNGDLKRSETELPANPIDNCVGGNLRFGAQAAFDVNNFNGSMDDIRIYNRVLTDAEVRELYTR
jgi:Concanavalin A-like lectin/glucanases superfamily